jgi:hypothetical protein
MCSGTHQGGHRNPKNTVVGRCVWYERGKNKQRATKKKYIVVAELAHKFQTIYAYHIIFTIYLEIGLRKKPLTRFPIIVCYTLTQSMGGALRRKTTIGSQVEEENEDLLASVPLP